MLYTGLDYHRSFSYSTTMNDKGEIVSQKKLPSNGELVGKEQKPLAPQIPGRARHQKISLTQSDYLGLFLLIQTPLTKLFTSYINLRKLGIPKL